MRTGQSQGSLHMFYNIHLVRSPGPRRRGFSSTHPEPSPELKIFCSLEYVSGGNHLSTNFHYAYQSKPSVSSQALSTYPSFYHFLQTDAGQLAGRPISIRKINVNRVLTPGALPELIRDGPMFHLALSLLLERKRERENRERKKRDREGGKRKKERKKKEKLIEKCEKK